jgi:hypothetical protein
MSIYQLTQILRIIKDFKAAIITMAHGLEVNKIKMNGKAEVFSESNQNYKN